MLEAVLLRAWVIVTDYQQAEFWVYWGFLALYIIQRSLADLAIARELRRSRRASATPQQRLAERID